MGDLVAVTILTTGWTSPLIKKRDPNIAIRKTFVLLKLYRIIINKVAAKPTEFMVMKSITDKSTWNTEEYQLLNPAPEKYSSMRCSRYAGGINHAICFGFNFFTMILAFLLKI